VFTRRTVENHENPRRSKREYGFPFNFPVVFRYAPRKPLGESESASNKRADRIRFVLPLTRVKIVRARLL